MKTNSPTPDANLLVVDDSPGDLELLIDPLGSRGFRLRPVPTGELALQAARLEPPDLILLDITMPGMDGYEVCRRLKADENLRAAPAKLPPNP